MKAYTCRKKRCGFTLIELLVTVAVIAILAGILLLRFAVRTTKDVQPFA